MIDRKLRKPALISWCMPMLAGLLAMSAANAQVTDANADWTARSTAAGVFYKNNFDFADTQALISSSYSGFTWPQRAQLETTNKLSGRGAFRALIPQSSDESTVAYRHSFDMPVGSQTKNTQKKTFYYQFQIYIPDYVLDHRFATVGNTSDTSHKFAIIQEPDVSFDVGEVVITHWQFRRFVTAYRLKGSTGSVEPFTKVWNTEPCAGSPEYGWQSGVDRGPQSSGGLTDASSCALFKRRYGPMHYSFGGTTNYGGGTLTAQGNPDADAAAGGVTWIANAWNVVEVFIDENANTLRLWHAKRGDAPRLVLDHTGTADLGTRAGNYRGVQLVPRLEELAPDSTRQDTYVIYGEIIASDQAINFPGGHSPTGSTGGGTQIAKPAPAWAMNMPAGTWSQIGTNTIASLDPGKSSLLNPGFPNAPGWWGQTGQESVITAWNGGAVATGFGAKGSLIAWGGGHQDYYGNELYAFDLATQTWSRLTNPFAGVSFPVTDGIWPDGSPSVPHTYGFAGYHAATNSFMSLITQTSNSPANATIPVMFDFDEMQWKRGPRNSSEVQYGGWAVYDESRDAWWMEGGDSGGVFAQYSMNGAGTHGSWTNYSAKFNALDSSAARDPVRDVLVIATFRQNSNLYGVDLKNPDGAPVLLTQGGSIPTREGAGSLQWSAFLQAFVWWRRGAEVWQIKPPAGDWKTGAWTWSKLTSSSNTVVPEDQARGVYNRFRLVDYSDAQVGVVVNSVTGKVQAFRIPAVAPQVPKPPVLLSVD